MPGRRTLLDPWSRGRLPPRGSTAAPRLPGSLREVHSLRGRTPGCRSPRATGGRTRSCGGEWRALAVQAVPRQPVTGQARGSAAGGPLSTQASDPGNLPLRLRTSSESAMSAWERQHQQEPRARGGFSQEPTREGRLRRSRISKEREVGMTPVIRSSNPNARPAQALLVPRGRADPPGGNPGDEPSLGLGRGTGPRADALARLSSSRRAWSIIKIRRGVTDAPSCLGPESISVAYRCHERLQRRSTKWSDESSSVRSSD
jgi:hypothetical protein